MSIGMLATGTVGNMGAHGAVMIRMQDLEVNTPKAADTADATEGFAGEPHLTKGIYSTTPQSCRYYPDSTKRDIPTG